MDDGFINTGAERKSVARSSMSWTGKFWLMLVCVLVFRLLYLLVFPCDLVGDETYYWDWGRRLSWGYFSKPPFIAWLMALAGWTGGNTVFGLRMWACLEGAGALIFIFLLGRRFYGERTGFFSAAIFAAIPGSVLLNILLTVDASLVLFWTGGLFFLHAFLKEKKAGRRSLYALGLGLVLGFGHLSKQIMWLFPAITILYLLFGGGDGRRRLRSPLLWGVLLGSYLFLVPTLVWNAHHGWITFLHTEHHFQGDGILSFPKNLGDFLGMQLGGISPLIAVLVIGLGISGLFGWRKLASRERFLVAFSGLPIFVMLVMTLRQSMNGNWAAAFYPAGIVLAVGWAAGDGSARPAIRFHRWFRSWLKPGLWVAVALSLLAYASPFCIAALGLTGAKPRLPKPLWSMQSWVPVIKSGGFSLAGDPLARLRGWDDFAREVQAVRETLPRKDAPIIVCGHRYNVSELAFYLPDQPRVYHWAAPGKVDSQYQIWGGLEKFAGQHVLIVCAGRNSIPELPESLRACLSGSTPKGDVVVDVGNGRKISASLYWSGFIGIPDADSTEEAR